MKNLRIVFMGTPEFAVPSLQKFLEENYKVVGVITAPDKPSGRGMQVTESAVKKFSLEKGLKILQPEKLKSADFINELKQLNADVQIVVAFRMLPEIVWNMPRLGTINLHASLLPQYRGAAPINWAIINGEKETGVTTFKLQHDIDTGNILLQKRLPIGDDETAGSLHDRMMDAGADLLMETIHHLEKNDLPEIKQIDLETIETKLHHAPKIFTETCEINWKQNTEEVYNFIRGLSPYPCAFSFLKEKKIKIFKTKKEMIMPQEATGAMVTDNKTFLKFACNNGYIHVKELQPQGKNKMNIEAFLRGWRNN